MVVIIPCIVTWLWYQLWQPPRINPAQVQLSVLESSRTSNGITLKAVRHPRGTLINHIFSRSDITDKPHSKWAKSYSIHQSLAETKYTEFKFYNQFTNKQRKT